VPTPEVVYKKIKDPHWFAGFASGEGCFSVKVKKSSSHRLGSRVQLTFTVTQHSRDAELLKSLVDFLGCGSYYTRNKQAAGDFLIVKSSDIFEKLIPFFDKYSILGVKALDYANFKTVAEITRNKEHLTESGFEKICKIKAGMNTLRKGN
jgi:hypothetical protein